MKGLFKGLSLLLTVLMVLSICAISVFAADAQKVTVTTEKTTIYEKASTESQKLISASKGYTFTPIASTKSFWKLEFKKKNDATVYTGFVLKADTNVGAIASSSTAKGATDSKTKVGMVYKPSSKSTGIKDARFSHSIPRLTFFEPSSQAKAIYLSYADIISITPVFIPDGSDFQIVSLAPAKDSYCNYDFMVKATKTGTVVLKVDFLDYANKPYVIYLQIKIANSNSKVIATDFAVSQGDTATTNTNGNVVRWVSSDSSIASVDQNGIITGNRSGIAFITAFFDDGTSDSAMIEVK